MWYTASDFWNDALRKIGAAPVEAVGKTYADAETERALYRRVREETLLAHPWLFTLARAELERDPAAPAGDFAVAYRLPPDCIRVISAGTDGAETGLAYRICDGRLYTDADNVVVTYQRLPQVHEYPPHVGDVLVARLAAELCRLVTGNVGRAEVLDGLAASALRIAKLRDARERAAP